MRQLFEALNERVEQRIRDAHREFLFNDLVNDRCSYDPSTHEEREYDINKGTNVFCLYFSHGIIHK